jgi:excinuclease ABC subunit B
MGRAARHLRGKAILYADRHTDSMQQAIAETNRRRAKQVQYNRENDITPETIIKPVDMALASIVEADYVTVPIESEDDDAATGDQLEELIRTLETRMREAAKQFEFEKAAQLRDRIKGLREKEIRT